MYVPMYCKYLPTLGSSSFPTDWSEFNRLVLAPAPSAYSQAEFPTRGRPHFFFLLCGLSTILQQSAISHSQLRSTQSHLRTGQSRRKREKAGEQNTHAYTRTAGPLHSERSAFRTQKSRSLFRLAPDSNHTHPVYSAAASFSITDHTRPELINVPSPDGLCPSSTRYVYLHWSCCNARALCFLAL